MACYDPMFAGTSLLATGAVGGFTGGSNWQSGRRTSIPFNKICDLLNYTVHNYKMCID